MLRAEGASHSGDWLAWGKGYGMRKQLLAGFGALALVCVSAPASAVTFVNVGDNAVINFNGLADDYIGGAVAIPGLTAKLTLTLTSIAGNTANFGYSLQNTSGGAITDSRVSIFAFNVPSGVVTSAVGGGDYGVVRLNDDFPNVGGIDRIFEVCFKAGGGPNCSAGGGGGTSFGETDNGTFSLTLSTPVVALALDTFGIRWQTLSSPEYGLRGNSGIGLGVPTPRTEEPPVVPEPATWAMMIAGFGLVGATMRRRKSITHVTA